MLLAYAFPAHPQVYVSKGVAASVGGFGALTSSGTSILVQGQLRKTPEGTLQVCCSHIRTDHALPGMS